MGDALAHTPKLTVLSFSGGTGSGCILEMVLRGDLPRPDPFLVVTADPGMENTGTYAYIAHMQARCADAGIPYIVAARNLYAELLALKGTGHTRFDTPPFWTKNRRTGKKGRLRQKCTGAYKIAPMDRAIRTWMAEHLGISARSRRIGVGTVVKWIGFSHDEWHRIKESGRKYIAFDYPLINRRMKKPDVLRYFLDVGAPLPPRSVCNACFANDLTTFAEMAQQRPADFEQACLIDDAIRDLSHIGVKDECFVSSTLIGLRELAAQDFVLPPKAVEQDATACHSGHCFI